MRRAYRSVTAILLPGLILAGCAVTSRPDTVDPCSADQYGCVHVKPGDPIQIGALIDLDVGPGVDNVDKGVQLAIDYLTGSFTGVPGQLLGHPIKLTIANGGCDRASGEKGAEALAAEPMMIGVIGPSCSASALGAANDILSPKGILTISPAATSPRLTTRYGARPFFFRTIPNDMIQGAVVASFFVNYVKARKVAVIYDANNPYSADLATVFERRFTALTAGGRVTNYPIPDPIPLGSKVDAARKLLIAAGRNRPDALYFPVSRDLCTQIVRLIANTPGLRRTTLVTSEACLSTATLAVSERTKRQVFASSPDLNTQANQGFYTEEFEPAYTRTFAEPPKDIYSAFAFDAANLMFNSIRRSARIDATGALEISRIGLRDAMLRIDGYNGVSGLLRCEEGGDCAQAAYIGVYLSPAWPVGSSGAAAGQQPVYRQEMTLARALTLR